jgi:hypothetical protein
MNCYIGFALSGKRQQVEVTYQCFHPCVGQMLNIALQAASQPQGPYPQPRAAYILIRDRPNKRFYTLVYGNKGDDGVYLVSTVHWKTHASAPKEWYI